jgi:hypothetical protein
MPGFAYVGDVKTPLPDCGDISARSNDARLPIVSSTKYQTVA